MSWSTINFAFWLKTITAVTFYRNQWPRVCHKFTFPAYLFYTNLVNLFYAQKKRRIFSKIALTLYRGFFHFGKSARSHEFLKFMFILLYWCYIPNLVRIGPVVLDTRRTPDGAGTDGNTCRSPKLLRWPTRKGNLRKLLSSLSTNVSWRF